MLARGRTYDASGNPVVDPTLIPSFGFLGGGVPALATIGDQVGVAFVDDDPDGDDGGELYLARVSGL